MRVRLSAMPPLVAAASVPEPQTYAMLALGLGLPAGVARRKAQRG